MEAEVLSRGTQIIPDSRGGRMVVPADGISPDGATYTFDWYLAPHSPAPPLHWHPFQQERFEVIAGQFTVTLGKTKHVLHPGDTITVPVRGLHAVANESDEEACARTVFAPALDSHTFFERLFAIERSSRGLGQIARMSVLFRDMPGYMEFPMPLRLVVTAAASITRLLGYRAPPPAGHRAYGDN